MPRPKRIFFETAPAHRVGANAFISIERAPLLRSAELAEGTPPSVGPRSRRSVPWLGDLHSVGRNQGVPWGKVGFVSGFVADGLLAATIQ